MNLLRLQKHTMQMMHVYIVCCVTCAGITHIPMFINTASQLSRAVNNMLVCECCYNACHNHTKWNMYKGIVTSPTKEYC